MFPGLSTVVPAELGTTDDPRALVPGDPGAILAKLATLTTLSAGIDEAASAFTKIDTDHWQGPAADGFRQVFSQEVPHWRHSATAFDNVRKALQDYGHTLRAAQNQAAEAIELFNRAVAATKTAQARYDAAAGAHTGPTSPGPTAPPMAPFSDPGAADRQEAQAKLADARKAVRNAGDSAARAVGTERDSAPQGPGPLQRAWAAVTETGASVVNANWHVATGEVSAVMDFAKPLAALNPIAAFTHPMSYVSNIANMGTGLMHAANHPVQLAKSMVDFDDWGKDPAAAIGKTAVNIGSLFAGGEGAGAKGADIGAQSAKITKVAGDAEKTAGTAGKTIEQASHQPWKPADWGPPIPNDGTPFGPRGSQSLLHDPPVGRPDGGFGPQGSDHPSLAGDHPTLPSHHSAWHGDPHDPAAADRASAPEHADAQPNHQGPHPDLPGRDSGPEFEQARLAGDQVPFGHHKWDFQPGADHLPQGLSRSIDGHPFDGLSGHPAAGPDRPLDPGFLYRDVDPLSDQGAVYRKIGEGDIDDIFRHGLYARHPGAPADIATLDGHVGGGGIETPFISTSDDLAHVIARGGGFEPGQVILDIRPPSGTAIDVDATLYEHDALNRPEQPYVSHGESEKVLVDHARPEWIRGAHIRVPGPDGALVSRYIENPNFSPADVMKGAQ